MVFTNRATSYVKLYLFRTVQGSWVNPDPTQPDVVVPFLDIQQYALDLLTDYDNEGFVLQSRGKRTVMKRVVPRQPAMDLRLIDGSQFEHWAQVRLGLDAVDLSRLEEFPRGSGVLVMSLLLCADAAAAWSHEVAYACLLRHVLGARVYRESERITECSACHEHLLLTAQYGLHHLEALRRLCTGMVWPWLEVGRASNAARALAALAQEDNPRNRVRDDLVSYPELLNEFDLLADVYDELQPRVGLQSREVIN